MSVTAVSEWARQLSLNEQTQRWMIGITLQFGFSVKHQSTLHQSRRTFNVHHKCSKNAQFACSSQLVTLHSSSYASRPALQWNKYKTSADAQKKLGTHRVVQSCVQSSRDKTANVYFLQCPPEGCISLLNDASRHVLKITGKKNSLLIGSLTDKHNRQQMHISENTAVSHSTRYRSPVWIHDKQY